MVILKYWLHISKEEQLRRFIDLTSNSQTAWQVTAEDWEHHRKYEEYLAAVRDMVTNTDTEWAPWTVVPATDRDAWLYVVFRNLIEHLEDALQLERTEWQDLASLSKKSDDEEEDEKKKRSAKRRTAPRSKDKPKTRENRRIKRKASRKTRKRPRKRPRAKWSSSLPNFTTLTFT